jgi:hypothetical protein
MHICRTFSDCIERIKDEYLFSAETFNKDIIIDKPSFCYLIYTKLDMTTSKRLTKVLITKNMDIACIKLPVSDKRKLVDFIYNILKEYSPPTIIDTSVGIPVIDVNTP